MKFYDFLTKTEFYFMLGKVMHGEVKLKSNLLILIHVERERNKLFGA